MPLDLSKTLVVGISATALFDLAEADKLFSEKHAEDPDNAIEEYRQYMLKHEDVLLNPGTGLPLVKALLNLNSYQKPGEPPIVEVVVMSRNSPETGIRVLKTIRSMSLGISRSAFTAGELVTDYLEAFDVDLFLTTSVQDAQKVIDSRACAAAILSPPPVGGIELSETQVRIAFDGDAVLFDEESEILFKQKGLEAFHQAEDASQDIPLAAGPYASLLIKIAKMQERLPMRVEYSPVRIAIVTARNSPAEMRVIKTLRHWGVYVDEAFFLGGVGKAKVLKAFKPHIFLDDQEVHLKDAASFVPSGRVPYLSGSPLATVAVPHQEVEQVVIAAQQAESEEEQAPD
jgi:5'-nucleotidase